MNIEIKVIPEELYNAAVDIFADAFLDDPLFLFAFPEEKQRKRLTGLMYEFVVIDMVSIMNLTLKGAFSDNKLIGCTIYTTPERNDWNDTMMKAIAGMREKANNERINLIGEFAMLSGYKPEGVYFYGNELAVKKEYRNHGAGKALNKDMVNDAKSRGNIKGILLDTASKFDSDMYRRWGWELKEVKDFYSIKKYYLWMDI